MKRALITGITGQDGSYLAKLLIEKGYHVTGIIRSHHSSNLSNLKYFGILEKVTLEECDLCDLAFVIGLIEKLAPDELYNLAAQSSVGLSFSHPTSTIQYNITSVLNLLEAIRLVNKSIRFYQASSSEMFGRVQKLPITLSTPMNPLSPYATSKASGYWTVNNFRESYNIFACNGILFNHESYLRPKNFFMKKVIAESVQIHFGHRSMLKVGNLDVKRDFGYAPSYVDAMWRILQQEKPQDFIICSGHSISLREIVNYIFKQLNIPDSKLVVDPELYRPVDIADIYGDNSSAKKQLGWSYDLDFKQVLDNLILEEKSNYKSPHEANK
jgi:GDPmannose 4,6-dehydratase